MGQEINHSIFLLEVFYFETGSVGMVKLYRTFVAKFLCFGAHGGSYILCVDGVESSGM